MSIYKGIFWYIKNQLKEEVLFPIKVECDSNGIILDATVLLSSKTGTNFNHELEWGKLPKSITQGKPFDYFPRGRVELKNKRGVRAVVYLHPSLCNEEKFSEIILQFNLQDVASVRFIADGSNHYQAKEI